LFRHQKKGYTGDQKTYHKNGHVQVQRHITRTHTGSQTYQKNTHRLTDIAQEHTQIHRHITRIHTGSQAYHKNTHRLTDISQEHTQIHRHITRIHTG